MTLNMKIGFLYYNFYPVVGGASVHGFHLAKELSKLGYELYKLNGEADPYTKKLENPATGFFWMMRNCDLIYVRMDYFINRRNLLALFALMSNKKVIIELNSPSDELHLFGRSKKYISRVDRVMSSVLKKADAVIVVSTPIQKYCEKELGLQNVYVIENGGVRFEVTPNKISGNLKKTVSELRSRYKKIVVWSGSPNKMQDLELLKKIADTQQGDTAFVLIVKDEKNDLDLQSELENLFLFKNLARDEVEFLIKSADIGLALYDDYPWSRWGFYNSSLKIFEYLNNELLTISNREGTEVQKNYSNFRFARNSEEILTFMDEYRGKNEKPKIIRTWKHVAEQTSNIIEKVANR
jgi:glycosyltransferase involved in cell wall biosynthesis